MHNNHQLISITGIDGCGKTTLTQNLYQDLYIKQGKDVCLIPCPQTYLNKDLSYYNVSKNLEKLSKWADKNENLLVKISATFLALTLPGQIFTKISVKKPCNIYIFERHPTLDCYVYSAFYFPLLRDILSHKTAKLDQHKWPLGQCEIDEIDQYAKEVLKSLYRPIDELHHLVYRIFSCKETNPNKVIGQLNNLFKFPKVDQLFIIEVPRAELETRLHHRPGTKEIHEQLDQLLLLQQLLVTSSHSYCWSRNTPQILNPFTTASDLLEKL